MSTQSTALTNHERTHNPEKPFKCERVLQATAFPNHKKTHTGEKSCKCPVCKTQFAKRHYIREFTQGKTPISVIFVQRGSDRQHNSSLTKEPTQARNHTDVLSVRHASLSQVLCLHITKYWLIDWLNWLGESVEVYHDMLLLPKNCLVFCKRQPWVSLADITLLVEVHKYWYWFYAF